MLFNVFVTLLLVLLNGFFVAAEFAIVKVRISQIEVRPNINKSLSAAARSIVNNLDAYLAATQLGITLASLGLGWVGEEVTTEIIMRFFGWLNMDMAVETAHKISVPVAFAFITVLHIVFGELAPKSLAIRYPTSTTFAIAFPLKVFYFVCRPFIWMLNGFANLILKIFGIRNVHGSDIHSQEELKMIITESHEGGAIEQTERELIQNVFDFDDRRVSDIQTLRKDISAIDADMPAQDALRFALTDGYSRYPVYGDSLDDIKGVLYTKDLMKATMLATPPQGLEGMIKKPYFVTENKKIKDLMKELQLKRQLMAIVTSEIGEVSGIVTMEDILEELVGEIQDEYDNEKPYVEKAGTNRYIVSAHRKLSDINKYLPYRLDESEQYETLSGLIAHKYPEELHEGDRVRLAEYEVTIQKMYRNSAETVEMYLVPEEEEDDE